MNIRFQNESGKFDEARINHGVVAIRGREGAIRGTDNDERTTASQHELLFDGTWRKREETFGAGGMTETHGQPPKPSITQALKDMQHFKKACLNAFNTMLEEQ